LPWLTALGAGGRLMGIRPDLRVGGGVLLEEPGRQFLTEVAGAILALGERDELVLVWGGKHLIEGGGGVFEPTTTELFVILRRRGRLAHGVGSWLGTKVQLLQAILSSWNRRRNGFAPSASPRVDNVGGMW
jgi:hypothetical protein